MVRIVGDESHAVAAVKRFNAVAGATERKFSKDFGRAIATTRAFAAGFAAVGAAAAYGIGKAVQAHVELETSARRVQAVLNANAGAVGRSFAEIAAFTERIRSETLFDRDELEQATAQLLTYKNIVGDTFERTLTLATNLSSVFGSLSMSTMSLAKALDDPIKGMGDLSRQGFTFDEATQATIRSLVEQNRLFDAQRIILAQLESETGDVAGAMKEGLGGALDDAGKSSRDFLAGAGNLIDSFGLLTRGANAWADALKDVTGLLNDFAEWNREHDLSDIPLMIPTRSGSVQFRMPDMPTFIPGPGGIPITIPPGLRPGREEEQPRGVSGPLPRVGGFQRPELVPSGTQTFAQFVGSGVPLRSEAERAAADRAERRQAAIEARRQVELDAQAAAAREAELREEEAKERETAARRARQIGREIERNRVIDAPFPTTDPITGKPLRGIDEIAPISFAPASMFDIANLPGGRAAQQNVTVMRMQEDARRQAATYDTRILLEKMDPGKIAEGMESELERMETRVQQFGDAFYDAMLHASDGVEALLESLARASASQFLSAGMSRITAALTADKRGEVAAARALEAGATAEQATKAGSAATATASAGGPVGWGLAAAGLALSIIPSLFGSDRDREQEIYRANLRALRDSREQQTIITLVLPKGPINPRDSEWKSAIAATLTEIGGTGTGGVQVRFVED